MENRRLCQLFQGRKKHTHTLKAPDANEGEGAVNSFQPWPPPKKKQQTGQENAADFRRAAGIWGKLFLPFPLPLIQNPGMGMGPIQSNPKIPELFPLHHDWDWPFPPESTALGSARKSGTQKARQRRRPKRRESFNLKNPKTGSGRGEKGKKVPFVTSQPRFSMRFSHGRTRDDHED